MAETPHTTALLETRGLTKRYPGVLALDTVDFTLQPGEVHVLFGENGAGKSTLISVLAGVQPPTARQVLFSGRPVTLDSVRAARQLGISAVFQEFSLVPTLTVAQNLFLGDEPRKRGLLDLARLRSGAQRLLEQLDFPVDPGATVAFLSRAEQQMVEIAKAFRGKLSVLILDEPTASLTEKETQQLFSLVERLKSGGAGIVFKFGAVDVIHERGSGKSILRRSL